MAFGPVPPCPSIMTSQAIVRCALLLVTTDTKMHRVIDNALGDRHRGEIAMASRAIDIGADMRRVIETHVRFFEESIHALPGHVFPALCMIPQRLNSWIRLLAQLFMTRHAEVHARDAGSRSGSDTSVAFPAFDSDFVDLMNFMREVDRLLRLGFDA